MRKWVIIIALLFPFLLCAQRDLINSWGGSGLAPNSHIRTLNIYVNVIYDVHPDTNSPFLDTTYWGPVIDTLMEGINVAGTIPTYLLSLFDTAYIIGNTNGCVTRIYGESSFDSLQISGDNVVVNVRESHVIADPTAPDYQRCHSSLFCYNKIQKVAVDVINEAGGLRTIYGHDSLSDYTLPGGNKISYTNILIRNITQAYGGYNSGTGCGNAIAQGLKIGDGYYSSEKGTLQCVGDGDISTNPTSILAHEISHTLFGGNNFHTSGGNHRGSAETMPFMNIQGGYGLMGGAGSGLVSCNGYERWRMHWKHPDAPAGTYIYSRNILDNSYLNSDICKEDGEKWFVLRDFVTYGDAIRIRLPYKDSITTPNQYIWLEFHNVGHNDKLDFLQYSNSSCLHLGTPGIYAYYQIGRDVLEGTSTQVWDYKNRDNLRIISNEGYWDYTRHLMSRDTDFVCTQWNWNADYYVPEFPNAFCGYQDQEKFIVPKWYDTDLGNTADTIQPSDRDVPPMLRYVIREYTMQNKVVGSDTIRNNISFIGGSLDAFSTHRKINMGTNPSTCNAKTYYTGNLGMTHLTFNSNTALNNTATYLTGLSIEMIPRADSTSFLVHIRWDDYDITDDARWTGKIILKGAEQGNLTRGHSITLAQNRTPAQRMRDSESGYFAEPTLLTCEAGSVFTQQPQTSLILTEKSRFALDSGATYHLGDSAQILVQSGSKLYIHSGSHFHGGIGSTIIVDSLGTLYVDDTAQLRRDARLIVRPGGKLIVNGGTLTSACEGEMWQGIIVEGQCRPAAGRPRTGQRHPQQRHHRKR